MIYLSFRYLAFVASIFLFAPVEAQVKVQIHDQIFQFEKNPRMLDVLANVASKNAIYWHGAKLFRVSDHEVENKRISVINDLAKQGKKNSKFKSEYQSLINQIKSWELADYIEVDIDFDRSRFEEKYNPRFDDGNYLLDIGKRPESLYIFGLVEQPKNIQYENNQCLSEILDKLDKTSYADKTFVYLLSPSSEFKRINIAYWSKECVLPEPGSQIFVPLRENQIFLTNSRLNKEILELSINRLLNK